MHLGRASRSLRLAVSRAPAFEGSRPDRQTGPADTPRKPRSKWSQVNREKAARLIESSGMRPAGLRGVERAKADRRWDAAYEPQSAATVPDDPRLALEENERARLFFEGLDRANGYAILHRIQDTKKPETRTRRIAKYVAMLAEGKKLCS